MKFHIPVRGVRDEVARKTLGSTQDAIAKKILLTADPRHRNPQHSGLIDVMGRPLQSSPSDEHPSINSPETSEQGHRPDSWYV